MSSGSHGNLCCTVWCVFNHTPHTAYRGGGAVTCCRLTQSCSPVLFLFPLLLRLDSYVKGIQLCGNLWLRNVFTSEQIYDNPEAFPRDMRLFIPKGKAWKDLYEYIQFPDTGGKPDEGTGALPNRLEEGAVSSAAPATGNALGEDAHDDAHAANAGGGEIREIDERLKRPGTHAIIRHHSLKPAENG